MMDFMGRATLPSKKNLQLISNNTKTFGGDSARAPVRFLLGKMSKDTFALDFSAPMSPVQACACALSMFVKQLTVQ
jgi:hypothetical protein